MDERAAALFKTWMDRTTALQAQHDMLATVVTALIEHAPEQARRKASERLREATRLAAGASWEYGVAAETEAAKLLRLMG